MYSVKTKIARGYLSETKADTFEKAKRIAWTSIQKPEVRSVEIWMGGLFHASIIKEGKL